MWPALSDEAMVLDDEVVTFADLLLLGVATGQIEEALALTRRGLAALREEGLELSREHLLEGAVAFRRARRLESGQDLRAWLEARELTMDDWEAHLRRTVAARELPGNHEATPATFEGANDWSAFSVDLACGSWWGQFADLAARLWAAARLIGEDLGVADSDVGDEATRVLARFEALAPFGESWCTEGLKKIRARQRALEEATRRCSLPDAVAARVLEHGADWTELRFDELLLPTREAANEAALCARDDGIDAAALALRTGLPLYERAARHDWLPVGTASLLDGALPDEPFGPVALEGQWAVLWLRERRRPSLEDEATREAASTELLEEALERAAQGLVREADVL